MRWQAPDNVDKISVQGHQIEVKLVEYVDRTGEVKKTRGVDAPGEAAVIAELQRLGFTKLAMPGDLKKVTNDTPPTVKSELRSDGPTFQEFVTAGYMAEAYPPSGYASKHTPEELETLVKAHNAMLESQKNSKLTPEEELALVAAEAEKLKGMTSDQLLKYCADAGLDVAKLPNRPLRLQAALDHIGYVEPKKD